MHNWQFSDKCISYLKEFMILELFVNFMILKEVFLTSNSSLGIFFLGGGECTSN